MWGNGLARTDLGMRFSWAVFLSLGMHVLLLTFFANVKSAPSRTLFIPVSLVSFERPPQFHSTPLTSSQTPDVQHTPLEPSVAPVAVSPSPRPSESPAPQNVPTPSEKAPALYPEPDLTEPAEPVLQTPNEIGDDPYRSGLPYTPKDTGNNQTASVSAISLGNTESNADARLSKYAYYFEGIQQKIGALWVIPSDKTFGEQQETTLAAVVGFVVQPDGQIKKKSVTLEKSSGDPFWDASALRAIYNADPLLPLPSAITEELRIHFEFKFQLHS